MGLGEYVRDAVAKLTGRVNQITAAVNEMRGEHSAIAAMIGGQNNITAEMNEIPGRRTFFFLNGEDTFDITANGQRGSSINMEVSQDGPFIMTHLPVVMWRPSAPNTTTNFGLWRPVSPWPLPVQAAATAAAFTLNDDIISLSWEMSSGGSQRNLQNEPSLPMFSRPDNLVPLPVPTMFKMNDTIQFFPTYESIRFTSAIPPTEGIIRVSLPGYRIV